MSYEDAYRLATGTDPVDRLVAAAGLDEFGLPVLSDEEVFTFLAQHLDPAQVAMYPVRAEPLDGVHPGGGWVTVDGFQLADGQALVVAYSIGQPHEDEMLSWKKVWREVGGPFSVGEAMTFAKEWKDGTHGHGRDE